MSPIRPLVLSTAVAVGAVLALTGCQSDDSSSKAASPPATSAPAGQPGAPAPASESAGAAAGGSAAGTTPTHTATPGGKGTGGGNPAAAGNDTDEYAWGHPCAADTISVQVKAMSGAATQRVIEVRNTGANSCGLDYFPLVDLGSAKNDDRSKNIKPVVPGGLGGAPAYTLNAGATAYAVLDLNPTNATAGTAVGVDEIHVLASDSLPNAATVSAPIGGTRVLGPKLGLYRGTAAEAAATAKDATMPMPS